MPFPTAALEIVRHALGPRAGQVVLGAQTVDRDRALALGLVDELTEPDELLPRAVALAAELAARPPEAYRLAKVQLHRPANAAIEATGATTSPSSRAGPPTTPGCGSRPRSRRWRRRQPTSDRPPPSDLPRTRGLRQAPGGAAESTAGPMSRGGDMHVRRDHRRRRTDRDDAGRRVAAARRARARAGEGGGADPGRPRARPARAQHRGAGPAGAAGPVPRARHAVPGRRLLRRHRQARAGPAGHRASATSSASRSPSPTACWPSTPPSSAPRSGAAASWSG